MRAIHAVRELNDGREDPIRVIALYSENERHALFVRQADERYCIGPASAYLDYDVLERALTDTKADAAWVGWGFVAEHPAFAELCDRLGIVFAGPDADVMRRLGDKIEAKKLAEQAGVPVAPWSGGPVETAEDAERIADDLGFPLMIKAAAGGGGRGMRRVEEAGRARQRVRARPRRGRAVVRRPVGADGAARRERPPRRGPADGRRRGHRVAARRARLLLPAPPPEGRRGVGQPGPHPRAGAQAGRRPPPSSRARSATAAPPPSSSSTSPTSEQFSFMEVNARLQVEHPVTEMVTGADLVALQLHVAAGGRLEGDPPPPSGHAIEVRLNAEDPARGFAPAPGRISLLRLPNGPGIRVDSGFAEGDTVLARLRLDARQDHRPRRHARAGDRPPAPRRRRHDGGDRRGHHQPGLPARAAGPPGAAQGRGRHRLARPPPGAGRRRARAPRRRRPRAGRDRAVRHRDGRRPRPLLRARASRPPAGGGRRRPHARPALPRRQLPLRGLGDRPAALPRGGRRGHDRGRRRAAHRARAPTQLRRARPTGR